MPAAPCSASTTCSASLSAPTATTTLLAIERDISPRTAAHWNKVRMNEALFARIDALYRKRDSLGLTPEQTARAGAPSHQLIAARARRSTPDKKQRLAAIIERLAALGTAFSQNVLADEQSYTLELDGEADLAGLPDFVREAAAAAAAERGMPGKHVITLQRSSVEPFLQFSSRRDLREKAFRAWIARGDNDDKTDNKAIIAETIALRAERAKLLGYPTFAHYRLDDAMAKTPEAVRGLLEKVWKPARAARARRPRRHAGADRARRAATSSSPPGTGATTPRSCASGAATSRRPRSSRTSSSTG